MTQHTYHTQAELMAEAYKVGNPDQIKVMEDFILLGFSIARIGIAGERCAILLQGTKVSGWLTPDAKFHRPVKGQTTVRLNMETLERVW